MKIFLSVLWKSIRDVLKLACFIMVIVYTLYSIFEIKFIKNDINDLRLEEKITRAYFDKNVNITYKYVKDLTKSTAKLFEENLKLTKKQQEILKTIDSLPKKIEDSLGEKFYPPDYDKLSGANYKIENITWGVQGSGTLIKLNSDYYILTCAHLLFSEEDKLIAKDNDDMYYPLELVKISFKKDLALFKLYIEDFKEDFDYLEIGELNPKVGDTIYIIGNPDGYEDLLTSGIISKKTKKYYYTTAPAFFGSSGGAIIYRGRLIGVLHMLDYSYEIFLHKEEGESIFYTIDITFSVTSTLNFVKEFLEG